MLDIGARKDMPHFFGTESFSSIPLYSVSVLLPLRKKKNQRRLRWLRGWQYPYALYDVLNHQKSPLIMYFLFNWHFAWVCGFGFGAPWLMFHVVPGFNTSMVRGVSSLVSLLTGYISRIHQFKMDQWQQSYPMDQ